MDACVLPFPTDRRAPSGALPREAHDAAPHRVAAHGTAANETGTPVAEVGLELTRLPHAGSRLTRRAEASLRTRCLATVLRALSEGSEAVRLAGTDAHPVIEAGYAGATASERAARAVLRADRAVRVAGRGEFVVSGGVATGRVRELRPGVRAADGSPAEAVRALIEKAAPGQILLGGSGWQRAQVDLRESRGPDPEAAVVYVLRGVR